MKKLCWLSCKINLGDISEIKKLTPSGFKDLSLCVSLNSETAANLVKQVDNWPKGIVIRPFSPRPGHGKSVRFTRVRPRYWLKPNRNGRNSYQHNQKH